MVKPYNAIKKIAFVSLLMIPGLLFASICENTQVANLLVSDSDYTIGEGESVQDMEGFQTTVSTMRAKSTTETAVLCEGTVVTKGSVGDFFDAMQFFLGPNGIAIIQSFSDVDEDVLVVRNFLEGLEAVVALNKSHPFSIRFLLEYEVDPKNGEFLQFILGPDDKQHPALTKAFYDGTHDLAVIYRLYNP